jgi:FAD/FMN-containing dehydrogenase
VAGAVGNDAMLAFDEATGVLRAEAGLTLDDLTRVFLPRGWFSPVAPGTRYVTLGGMVASDIHGKNHHVAGTIGQHVRSLRMLMPSGEEREVSRTSDPTLFAATLGGMGLTGHILDVTLQLEAVPSPWIWREEHQVPNLDALLDGLEKSTAWPQTVAWIDTLATGRHFGRGVLMRGRWAKREEAPLVAPRPIVGPSVPFALPEVLLNAWTMRAFNEVYYRKQLVPVRAGVVNPYGWFWPLDAVQNWSRAYGTSGFTQHQAVFPRAAGRQAVRAFCEKLVAWGGTGFLAVVKDCGDEGEGLLSFPEPGTSLALDLPIRPGIQELIDRLNRLVLDFGGRIYLTKDQYTRREDFERMEERRLPAFREVRAAVDPHRQIRSRLGDRLIDDPRPSPAVGGVSVGA